MTAGYGTAEDSRAPLYPLEKLVTGTGVTGGVIGTAVPTAGLRSIAHGRIPDNGCLCVGTTIIDTIKLYIFEEAPKDWWLSGSAAIDNTKTFTTAKTKDYFFGPPGSLYFLQGTNGGNAVWDNGQPI